MESSQLSTRSIQSEEDGTFPPRTIVCVPGDPCDGEDDTYYYSVDHDGSICSNMASDAKSSSPSRPTQSTVTNSLVSDNLSKHSQADTTPSQRNSVISAKIIENPEDPDDLRIPAFAKELELFQENTTLHEDQADTKRSKVCCINGVRREKKNPWALWIIVFIAVILVVVSGVMGLLFAKRSSSSSSREPSEESNYIPKPPTLAPVPAPIIDVTEICEYPPNLYGKYVLNIIKREQLCQFAPCSGNCVDNSDCAAGLVCTDDPNIFGNGGSGRENEIIPGCNGTPVPNVKYCIRPMCSASDVQLYSTGDISYIGRRGTCLLKECSANCKKDIHCAPGLKCYQRNRYEHNPPGCKGDGKHWNLCYKPSK